MIAARRRWKVLCGLRLRAGWRNGYEPKGFQIEAGLVVPQLPGTEKQFRSKLAELLGRRSVDLEGLLRGMYVCAGCPSRT